MIVNGLSLILADPIKNMTTKKHREHGVSWGLSEVGYDLRVKQTIQFYPPDPFNFLEQSQINEEWSNNMTKEYFFGYTNVIDQNGIVTRTIGRTALASSVEEFQIPNHLWGELRNKSTHARRFIDATLGTDMEPGWKGFLTIEIKFDGNEPITLPAGSGIAKAVFHELKNPSEYIGKYQNQDNKPIPAILETDKSEGMFTNDYPVEDR